MYTSLDECSIYTWLRYILCAIYYFLSIVNLKLILYPLKSVNRMKQLRRLWWKQHIGTGAKASQHTRFRCELNWNIVIFKFRLSSFKAECDKIPIEICYVYCHPSTIPHSLSLYIQKCRHTARVRTPLTKDIKGLVSSYGSIISFNFVQWIQPVTRFASFSACARPPVFFVFNIWRFFFISARKKTPKH